MSRNGSGTYTLPSGNPVVSGTLIEASWANTTLSDIATALTDSLSRSGQGGMTAALRLFDGTNTVPGLAWGSETTTGWYRAGAGDMRLVITGSQVIQYLSTGVAITGTLSASGNATVGGTLAVTGAMTLTANPTLSAGTANGVLYLNGSKVATSGSALTFDGTTLTASASASTTGNFKSTSSAAQVFNLTASNDANTTIGLGVQGSASGVIGMIGSAQPFLGTAASELNIYNNNASGVIKFGLGASVAEQMRLTSTGLGIGTSSPASKLEVQEGGTGSSYGVISATATGGGNAGYGFKTGGTIRWWIDTIGSAGSESLRFYSSSASAERMRLDSSGNLGLGVTPSAWGSGDTILQVKAGSSSGFVWGRNGSLRLGANSYYDGTNQRYITSSTAAFSIANPDVGGFQWYIAPSGTAGNAITFTQAMTLDASGNLGVGTTSPTNTAGYQTIEVNGSSGGIVRASYSTSVKGYYFANSAGVTLGSESNDALMFRTNATERARIDSSGRMGLGTDSPDSNYYLTVGITSSDTYAAARFNRGTTSSTTSIAFANPNGVVGTVSTSGTSTAYNTSSDYRLKHDIAPMTGALAKVAALKPVTYKWNTDNSNGEGFIAHELAEVVPQAVTGAKDAVDADGNPVYQGIDTSFLVATLTAALQEAVAEINSLKARLDAANL